MFNDETDEHKCDHHDIDLSLFPPVDVSLAQCLVLMLLHRGLDLHTVAAVVWELERCVCSHRVTAAFS